MEESTNRLRTAALKRRAAADPECCRTWGRLIQDKVLDHPSYHAARTVAAYRALGNEVGTSAIIDHALAHQKQVFVPNATATEAGSFVQVFGPGDRPKAGAVVSVCASELAGAQNEPLVVIVPGVLFDPHGHRLGRGHGWYDRFLKVLGGRPVRMGLAYEFQIVPRIPSRAWDEQVHFVVTESSVIDCGTTVRAMVR